MTQSGRKEAKYFDVCIVTPLKQGQGVSACVFQLWSIGLVILLVTSWISTRLLTSWYKGQDWRHPSMGSSPKSWFLGQQWVMHCESCPRTASHSCSQIRKDWKNSQGTRWRMFQLHYCRPRQPVMHDAPIFDPDKRSHLVPTCHILNLKGGSLVLKLRKMQVESSPCQDLEWVVPILSSQNISCQNVYALRFLWWNLCIDHSIQHWLTHIGVPNNEERAYWYVKK